MGKFIVGLCGWFVIAAGAVGLIFGVPLSLVLMFSGMGAVDLAARTMG